VNIMIVKNASSSLELAAAGLRVVVAVGQLSMDSPTNSSPLLRSTVSSLSATMGTEDTPADLATVAAKSRLPRALPFTLLFQGFVVLSLVAVTVTVLALFNSVTGLAIEGVREHYLTTSSDESAFLLRSNLDDLVVIGQFAAATARVNIMSSSNAQLARHARSSLVLFPRGGFDEVLVIQGNGNAAACVGNTSTRITCASGAYSPSNTSWSWVPEDVLADVSWPDLSMPATLSARWCFNESRITSQRVFVTPGLVPSLMVETCEFFNGVGDPAVSRAIAPLSSIITFLEALAPSGLRLVVVNLQVMPAVAESFETVNTDAGLGARLVVAAPRSGLLATVVASLTDAEAEGLGVSLAVMISVSIAFLFATCVATALALRLVLAPLAVLKADMIDAARLRLDRMVPHRSIIAELDSMATTFHQMVERLRSYRPIIAELRETSHFLRDRLSSQTSTSAYAEHAQHLIRIQLEYVSRKAGQVKRATSFEHTYRDGDPRLLENLLDTCKLNVGAHRFEVVQLTVQELSREQVTVATNRHLEEVIASSPGTLHIHIRKNGEKKLLSPVALFVDLFSSVLNVVLIFWLAFAPEFDRADRVSMSVFAGFYALVIGVNVVICLWLLRQGQAHERFREWVGQAAMEVSILLLVGSQNTQHIHFLWSNWTFAGALFFNAPRVMSVWRNAVSLSYFGFVFGDLGQISFKLYRLSVAKGGDGFLVFVGLSLLVSLTSVVLHAPKKLAHLATARSKSRSSSYIIPGTERNEGDASDELRRPRPRWGHFRSLTAKRVATLLLRIPQGNAKKRVVTRFASECGLAYSCAFKHIKGANGTVLYFHAFEIAAVFNANHAVDDPLLAAFTAARDAIADVKAESGMDLTAAIALDNCPVGSLGTAKRKSQHCFCDWMALRRAAIIAEALQLSVVCTARSRPPRDDESPFVVQDIPFVEDVLSLAPRSAPRVWGAQTTAAPPVGAVERQRLKALVAPYGFCWQTSELDPEVASTSLATYMDDFVHGRPTLVLPRREDDADSDDARTASQPVTALPRQPLLSAAHIAGFADL
jgi:hypothetical protein